MHSTCICSHHANLLAFVLAHVACGERLDPLCCWTSHHPSPMCNPTQPCWTLLRCPCRTQRLLLRVSGRHPHSLRNTTLLINAAWLVTMAACGSYSRPVSLTGLASPAISRGGMHTRLSLLIASCCRRRHTTLLAVPASLRGRCQSGRRRALCMRSSIATLGIAWHAGSCTWVLHT